MTNDFSQVMAERTDKQLVDIVTIKQNEYTPEAIIAAKKELENRQINADTFYSDEEKKAAYNAIYVPNEELPFETIHIILTFLLPAVFIAFWSVLLNLFADLSILRMLGFPAIVLVHYLIHDWLKKNRYIKRAKEFLKWISYTLYIYIGLLLVFGLVVFFISKK